MEERPIYEDEMSFKDIILTVQEYSREVIRNWKVVGVFCVITLSFFLYRHFSHIPTYNAELRFVVEGQGGVGGGLGGILGSFGLNKQAGVNPYKILEVAKSSKTTQEVLFHGYSGDTTIADKLLEEYDLVEQWSENNEEYENFYFTSDTLSRPIEKSAFKRLKYLIWGSKENTDDALSRISLDEETGLYSISTAAKDERLSIAITTRVYDGIKQFFEDEIFENQKRSAAILSAKKDSVMALKNAKVYQLARFEDRNQQLLLREDATQRAILTQEIQALNIAYAELLKSYEMSDVNLKNLQPLFMEIDRPFSPISPNKSSLMVNIVLGGLLGSFLAVLWIIGRYIYRKTMDDPLAD